MTEEASATEGMVTATEATVPTTAAVMETAATMATTAATMTTAATTEAVGGDNIIDQGGKTNTEALLTTLEPSAVTPESNGGGNDGGVTEGTDGQVSVGAVIGAIVGGVALIGGVVITLVLIVTLSKKKKKKKTKSLASNLSTDGFVLNGPHHGNGQIRILIGRLGEKGGH